MIDRAINAIIRPPRTKYNLQTMKTTLVTDYDDENTYVRHPFIIHLPRNERVVGSLYHSSTMNVDLGGPCVVYMHGNSSSQLEGQFLVPNLCQFNIFVFCFDFVGCGCSSGEHISLGYFEHTDTEFILNKLKSVYNLGPFILWGRSMGAATALLVNNPDVIGIIADSPFSTLKDMCTSIAKSNGLPSLFVPTALWYIQKKIIRQANFKLSDVSPLEAVKSIKIPILYGHTKDDEFIPVEETIQLYNATKTETKYLNILPGGHNDKRPASWLRYAISFVLDRFHIHVDILTITECRTLQNTDQHFASFQQMINNMSSKNPEITKEFERQKRISTSIFTMNINQTDEYSENSFRMLESCHDDQAIPTIDGDEIETSILEVDTIDVEPHILESESKGRRMLSTNIIQEEGMSKPKKSRRRHTHHPTLPLKSSSNSILIPNDDDNSDKIQNANDGKEIISMSSPNMISSTPKSRKKGRSSKMKVSFSVPIMDCQEADEEDAKENVDNLENKPKSKKSHKKTLRRKSAELPIIEPPMEGLEEFKDHIKPSIPIDSQSTISRPIKKRKTKKTKEQVENANLNAQQSPIHKSRSLPFGDLPKQPIDSISYAPTSRKRHVRKRKTSGVPNPHQLSIEDLLEHDEALNN